MEPATTVIVQNLQARLSSARPLLYREGLLFALAMAAACVVVPAFIVWALSRRDRKIMEKGGRCKAYTHRESSQKSRFVVSAALLVSALRKLWLTFRDVSAGGPWLTGLTVLLLPLAVWAAYRLWKWRASGLLMTGGYILCYAALEQYRSIRYAVKALDTLEDLPVMFGYAQYIAADYQVTWAMASGVLALAVLAFLTVYGYRRRFLFLPGRLDASHCANCGQIISGEGGFCTNCGQPLRLEPDFVRPAVLSLDRKVHCAKCGRGLFKSSCPVCDTGKDLTDTLKEAGREAGKEAGDKLKGSLRNAAAMAFFILFITVVPGQLSPLSYMIAGSASVHNAFAERLIELGENPDLMSDSEWLAGFDAAANALYAVEARWIYAEPRRAPSGELLAMPAYAEASLLKMELLEQIREIVHTGQTEEAGGGSVLLAALQYTAQMQLTACQYLNVSAGPLGPLEILERGCLDGVRAVLWRVKTEWISGAVLAVCALLCLWRLNSLSVSEATGLELRLQSLRVRADRRGKKYAVGAPPAAASALGRAFAAGKGVWFGLLRTGNELWSLTAHLLGAVVLLLSLLRPRNFRNLFRWVRDALTDGPHAHPVPSAAYQRGQRTATAIGLGLAGCIIVIAFASSWISYRFPGNASQMDKPAYLAAAMAAASDYAGPITDAVSNMQAGGAASEEELRQLYDLLRAQAEADRVILDMDLTALEDMDGLKELHAGLCSLCADDLAALERIMAALEAGETPSLELLENYIRLRGENYHWVTWQLFMAYVVYGMETAA